MCTCKALCKVLLQWLQVECNYIPDRALSQNSKCLLQGQLRSKSNRKQTQFLLTLNTKMVLKAAWPLAVAILVVDR